MGALIAPRRSRFIPRPGPDFAEHTGYFELPPHFRVFMASVDHRYVLYRVMWTVETPTKGFIETNSNRGQCGDNILRSAAQETVAQMVQSLMERYRKEWMEW